ncbi:MAG: plasmid stabilization protein [Candidatus Lindowbacteria bacterium RIFCSPLOWO2_12_FULL_62_27]|nr:MAG: plasmid stabilization protein [Candidatus Lindowbacteria bacterium RIFCSPLOWO2_12_FULL_62_27]OGH63798.1 MAG: plasmid stabilization protein [Candidatus Lindowbacteria bacterium RIFCSPLOWO2_02_FULL_62_12]
MIFTFHPAAETEFIEAVDYYEKCGKGLGYDFSMEVYSAIRNVVDFPKAWPIVEGDARRCLTNRFPFGVLYSIEPDRIFILAIMHLRRHPDYWKERKPNTTSTP